MTEPERNKRAFAVLGVAVALALVYWLITRDSRPKTITSDSSEMSVALAEKRLQRLRSIAAALPEREKSWKLISDELAKREKVVIAAEDKDLAQEKLMQMVDHLARSQAPPIEIRARELNQPRRRGDYGEVLVTVTFACRIEQLVNFLADLPAQPEAIACENLRVISSNPETKIMQVRVAIAGLVPAKLVPTKKETSEF